MNEIWSNLDPQIQAWQAANPNARLIDLRAPWRTECLFLDGVVQTPTIFDIYFLAYGPRKSWVPFDNSCGFPFLD